MKKVLSVVLSLSMVAMLSACSSGGGETTTAAPSQPEATEAAKTQETEAESTETEETAAEAASLDDYVYEGDALEIHLGDINSQFPLNLAYNLGYLEKSLKAAISLLPWIISRMVRRSQKHLLPGIWILPNSVSRQLSPVFLQNTVIRSLDVTVIQRRCILWLSAVISRMQKA